MGQRAVSECSSAHERLAVVTGAARGIGAATVRALADEGWRVLAVDRAADDNRLPYRLGTAEQLDALRQAGRPGQIIPVAADATDSMAIATAIAAAELEEPGIDAVIAAAGVIAGGVPLWEMPLEQQQAVLENNLGAALATVRATVPSLLRRDAPREGRFIAVASSAARKGLPMLAAYCAAKAAITGMIRALALELRGTGVTANAVSPGSTRTPILEQSARLYALPSAEMFAAQQPIERLLEPEEIARLIVWLAGPGGAGITGADLPIDGGLAL